MPTVTIFAIEVIEQEENAHHTYNICIWRLAEAIDKLLILSLIILNSAIYTLLTTYVHALSSVIFRSSHGTSVDVVMTLFN